MEKPLVSLRSLSHFAKVSSPFLQRALCSFIKSSRKSKEQEEETLPQEVDTGFFFVFFFSLSHFTFLPWFFPHFSIVSTFTVDDTSVRGPELVVPEVVVESAPEV